MDVLLLGGTNFIGRHIAQALLPRHHVTLLNRGSRPPFSTQVGTLRADRTEPSSIRAALTSRFDAVVDVSAVRPRHVLTTAPVLREGGTRRYIFISSGAVYDSTTTPRPFREDAPAPGDPVWDGYGGDKAECERILTGLGFDDLVILRPPYVYGPGNNEQREQFLWARMLAGRPIFVPGDGDTELQFCPVDHLADVVSAAVDGVLGSGTYNVGETAAYTINDYLEVLRRAANLGDVRTRNVDDASVRAREYFPFRDYSLVLDLRRLRAAFPRGPVRLADGLAETYAWFRANGDLRYEPTPRERAFVESR